jgi:outer membrane immunogenic protein
VRNRLMSGLAVAAFSFAGSGLAISADMAVKAPPVPAIAASNWTGFHVGGNIGAGWDRRGVGFAPNDPAAFAILGPTGLLPASFNSSSVIGGLQLGYDWQFNRNWLAGLETDFDLSNLNGAAASNNPASFANPTGLVGESVRWFGTARARFGYLPTQNLLTYVTAGFAYADVNHNGSYAFSPTSGLGATITANGFSVACGTPAGLSPVCFAGAHTAIATGWTWGGGVEYAFWQNWSVKAEYLYASLNGQSLKEIALVVFTPGNAPASVSANFSHMGLNIARVGVNYHF